MKVLAVIPARGGSKSIPGKNVKIVAGKPLIAHTIENAKKSKMIDRIIVSTDDERIGTVAEQYGAQVVWRPSEISGDTAASELALLHVLDFLIPFHYFLWSYDELGNAVGINHEKETRLMRQQREPEFRETGGVYAMRTQGFEVAKHRFFGRTALHVTAPEHCLEIDEPADIAIAEILLREQE